MRGETNIWKRKGRQMRDEAKIMMETKEYASKAVEKEKGQIGEKTHPGIVTGRKRMGLSEEELASGKANENGQGLMEVTGGPKSMSERG